MNARPQAWFQQAQDDLGSTTGLWVTGDSVILGIRSKLEAKEHISLINARVGRQAPELLAVMRVDQSSVPSSPVIFNLGNNNALSEQTVVDIFEVIKHTDHSADYKMTRSQTHKNIQELVDLLPEEQREIIVLRHYANLSFKEIAQMTNCSINTALGRMRYGLINLRKMMSERGMSL